MCNTLSLPLSGLSLSPPLSLSLFPLLSLSVFPSLPCVHWYLYCRCLYIICVPCVCTGLAYASFYNFCWLSHASNGRCEQDGICKCCGLFRSMHHQSMVDKLNLRHVLLKLLDIYNLVVAYPQPFLSFLYDFSFSRPHTGLVHVQCLCRRFHYLVNCNLSDAKYCKSSDP